MRSDEDRAMDAGVMEELFEEEDTEDDDDEEEHESIPVRDWRELEEAFWMNESPALTDSLYLMIEEFPEVVSLMDKDKTSSAKLYRKIQDGELVESMFATHSFWKMRSCSKHSTISKHLVVLYAGRKVES
jgi:hypothetical protein